MQFRDLLKPHQLAALEALTTKASTVKTLSEDPRMTARPVKTGKPLKTQVFQRKHRKIDPTLLP